MVRIAYLDDKGNPAAEGASGHTLRIWDCLLPFLIDPQVAYR
jgi:hypothetical protein